MKNITDFTCTVQNSRGEFCDAPSYPDMPYPVCARHAIRLWKRVTDHLEARGNDPLARARLVNGMLDGFEAKRPAPETRVARVYYVQVGELIKIGTTVTIKQRMLAYGPARKLLTTELGGYELERQRHRQFARLLEAGNEWFRPGPELIEHINGLRKANGAPPLEIAST